MTADPLLQDLAEFIQQTQDAREQQAYLTT
jgi:hypothetical protein